MTDILGVPAFGGGGFSQRVPPDQPRPSIPHIAQPANDGTSTSQKGRDLPGQNGDTHSKTRSTSDAAQDAPKARGDGKTTPDAWDEPKRLDPYTLTGPTPAFQASVLEMESDLRNVIAQVEAKRALKTDESAIAPSPASALDRAPSGLTGTSKGAQTGKYLGQNQPVEESQPDSGDPQSPSPSKVAAADTQIPSAEAVFSKGAASLSTPYDP